MDEDEFNTLPDGTLFLARRLERDWKDYDKRVKGKWSLFMKLDRDDLAVDTAGRQTLVQDLVENSATILFTPEVVLPVEKCEHTHQGISACPWCGFDPLGV